VHASGRGALQCAPLLVLPAGINVRMLKPQGDDAKRLVSWVEHGAGRCVCLGT
jgi:hypothetical protein